MKTNKKPKSKLHLLSIVWGILFSVFIFLTLGIKVIGGFFDDGPGTLKLSLESFVNWDDPGPYFITYAIGYLIVLWKPLWGSIIIMAASIYIVILLGFDGPPIFAAPGFLVGLLYLLNWFITRKNQIKN